MAETTSRETSPGDGGNDTLPGDAGASPTYRTLAGHTVSRPAARK